MRTLINSFNNGNRYIEIDNSIYEPQALLMAAYKISDRINVFFNKTSDNKTQIVFEAKEENEINIDKDILAYNEDLIDQQLRIKLEETFKEYRNKIVNQAFAPIAKYVQPTSF